MSTRLARTGNDLPRGWRRAHSGNVFRRLQAYLAVVKVQLGADLPPFELMTRDPDGNWTSEGFSNLDDAMAAANEILER